MRTPVVSYLSGLLLAAVLPAQRDLATAVPAHTWAFATDAGLDATAKTFHDAKLVGVARNLIDSEGWQHLQGLARQQAGRDFDEALGFFGRVGLDVGRVRALVAGPIALAVGRLTFMGDNVVPSFALLTDVKDEAAVAQCLADLERLIGQAQPGVACSDATVAGHACRRLAVGDGAISIVHGIVDRTWIATNSEGFFADSVAAIRGQVPNLATNTSLVRGRSEMHGTRLLEVFVNLQQFSASLTPLLPYEVARIGAELGASDLPDLYLASSHDGKGACDVLAIQLPGAKTGMLKAALSKGASNAAARWVKPSTSLFASLRIDARAAAAAFDQLMGAIPQRAANEMQKEMSREITRELRRELGTSPQEVLAMLSSLGSEVSIAVDTPRPTPPFVTLAVFVELADVQRAEGILTQLAQSGRIGNVQSENDEGVRLWTLETEIEGFKMSPSWGIRDGWLVGSNFKNVAKRLLTEGPLASGSLADDPRFQKASKAAGDAAVFVTARLNPILQNYWGLAMTGIQMGAGYADLEIDELPTGDDMAAAIDDIVFALRADEHGFVLRQHQPLGLASLVAASGAGLEWFLAQAPKRIY